MRRHPRYKWADTADLGFKFGFICPIGARMAGAIGREMGWSIVGGFIATQWALAQKKNSNCIEAKRARWLRRSITIDRNSAPYPDENGSAERHPPFFIWSFLRGVNAATDASSAKQHVREKERLQC